MEAALCVGAVASRPPVHDRAVFLFVLVVLVLAACLHRKLPLQGCCVPLLLVNCVAAAAPLSGAGGDVMSAHVWRRLRRQQVHVSRHIQAA